MMFLHRFIFGSLKVNTYLIWDSQGNAVVIDPGCHTPEEKKRFSSMIRDKALQLQAMLFTHTHLDHILGARYMYEHYQVQSWIHEQENYQREAQLFFARLHGIQAELIGSFPDQRFSDGQSLCFGSVCLEVIHIPAHTEGSVCFYAREQGWLFTGDTLRKGSLCFSNKGYAPLLNKLQDRVLILPGDTRFFFGHGEDSSLAEEKASNIFFRRMKDKK